MFMFSFDVVVCEATRKSIDTDKENYGKLLVLKCRDWTMLCHVNRSDSKICLKRKTRTLIQVTSPWHIS
jgi:hypothetical protein